MHLADHWAISRFDRRFETCHFTPHANGELNGNCEYFNWFWKLIWECTCVSMSSIDCMLLCEEHKVYKIYLKILLKSLFWWSTLFGVHRYSSVKICHIILHHLLQFRWKWLCFVHWCHLWFCCLWQVVHNPRSYVRTWSRGWSGSTGVSTSPPWICCR